MSLNASLEKEVAMNRSLWNACSAPEEMLCHVSRTADDRLLRLFACACCRLIWRLLPDQRARKAVEVSECFADGLVTPYALKAAEIGARSITPHSAWLPAWAAAEAAAPDTWHAALWTAAGTAEATAEAAARLALAANARFVEKLASIAWHEERTDQCAVLRDIFGTPFQSVRVNPYWLLWKNGRVVQAACSIYDEGRFNDLAHVGRLLEEAGCNDLDILSHCRRPHGHVRGCWVLDLLLGKRAQRVSERRRDARYPVSPTVPLYRLVQRQG